MFICPLKFALSKLENILGSDSKESAYNAGDRVLSLGQEDPLERGMATYSSILACRIPWTEEPGRLQSTGSQRGMTEQLSMHAPDYLALVLERREREWFGKGNFFGGH